MDSGIRPTNTVDGEVAVLCRRPHSYAAWKRGDFPLSTPWVKNAPGRLTAPPAEAVRATCALSPYSMMYSA
ncbi:hypothetical protein ACIG56_13755 [Nocardia fusca]|uniref:hypothetical protein n=1 Tax=Nocardia fusca TaxID=941183 RepID=UPI0037CC96CB